MKVTPSVAVASALQGRVSRRRGAKHGCCSPIRCHVAACTEEVRRGGAQLETRGHSTQMPQGLNMPMPQIISATWQDRYIRVACQAGAPEPPIRRLNGRAKHAGLSK